MRSLRLRVKDLLIERCWTTKILAEKTGLSESYLTHIKNGTRRWNEDALRKLSNAFELHPLDLFDDRRGSEYELSKNSQPTFVTPANSGENLKVQVLPVVGEIPSHPSEENNRVAQVATGYKGVFVPAVESRDASMFCLCVESNAMSPRFQKGDYLVISPDAVPSSGDLVAIEYGEYNPVKAIMQISFMDGIIVLESVNHKKSPIALIRGKDTYRVIGKVLYRYQKCADS